MVDDWYNYPYIGSNGIPEDVFRGLKAEFDAKLPFQMAYWEYGARKYDPNHTM